MSRYVRLATSLWSAVLLLTPLAVDAGEKSGEDLYREVCQSCHMIGGKGAKSPTVNVPSLANNPALGVSFYPVMVILNGRAGMPWFNGLLTPAQIAAVATYIRTNFGNDFPEPVTEDEVKQAAPSVPSPEA